ncbi:hypothetical protein Q1695_000204 [Nippostrongylus brasiliensis]|nr:hypothetical protein Q1695_000204 [Nippostrongylus brasiliensis]
MAQEVFSTGLRTVQQCLEALRDEHNTERATLESSLRETSENEASIAREKHRQITDNMTRISSGLEEVTTMVSILSYLNNLEAEKEKYQAQHRRLCQANSWLREELSSTQIKLQASEQRVATLEEENKHLKYMNSTKQFDIQSDVKSAPSESNRGGQFAQPTPAHSMAASKSVGYKIPARLRILHNLVIQYASQGRYEIAVPLCKQALEYLEKASGHDHPDVATVLNILALVYRDQKKYKEAANFLNEALAIRKKCLGENHPEVAATLNNLAVLYGKLGKFKDAEQLCKRALEIRKKVLGHNNPIVAKLLNNLALLCQKQRK